MDIKFFEKKNQHSNTEENGKCNFDWILTSGVLNRYSAVLLFKSHKTTAPDSKPIKS